MPKQHPPTLSTRGDRIRTARGNRSVEDCAKSIGVLPSRWYHWEGDSGKPSAAHLLLMARVLERSPEWLEFGRAFIVAGKLPKEG